METNLTRGYRQERLNRNQGFRWARQAYSYATLAQSLAKHYGGKYLNQNATGKQALLSDKRETSSVRMCLKKFKFVDYTLS